MTFIHQKAKTILIAMLATLSFVLFTQHINADTYSLSGPVTEVHYESGSLTISPNSDGTYTEIKGFSGKTLKAIDENPAYTIYDFKLKNKNEMVSYKINKSETNKNNLFSFDHVVIILIIIFGLTFLISFFS